MDKTQFADPGPAYLGVTLWMLNDRLEPDEIARQLAGFKAAGWGAVITRTFNGLPNLLGPHHRLQGEPDQCWGTDSTLDLAWLEDEEERQAHWTDDYFTLYFGMPGGACARYLARDLGEGG